MGALLDAVPAGGADHTEHHRDLATAIEAVPAAYQPLDSDLTAIAALTTTAYGRGLLSLANQAALQAEAGGSALVAGVDYPTHATVTLSSANILDLHNTPITLVAAPGAGKWLLVHRVGSYFEYGTVAYAGVDPVVYIEYDGTTTSTVPILADRTADHTEAPVITSAFTTAAATDRVNKALTAIAFDAITDGDGTLTVTVWYTVEDVP